MSGDSDTHTDSESRAGGLDPDLVRRLTNRLVRLWPRYQQGLSDLIRIPSILGSEAPAQQHIAQLAESAGLDVEMWDVRLKELQRDSRYAPVDGSFGVRPNVTAVLPGTGDKAIAVSGHIDVVSPEPLAAWTRDPWGGQIVGDRMYGRGALDMKGGLIAGLLAVHAIRDTFGNLGASVVFESVIEEECSGNGTLAARLHGPAVQAALIPEVTGEHLQTANTGVLWFELQVSGRAGYVGLAGESVNAIEVSAQLITALQTIPEELNALPRHPVYAPYHSPYTLNIGSITGGDWPSNVPLECRIGCRLSFPADWSVERGQQFVQDRLQGIAQADPWLRSVPPRLRWNGFRAHGHHLPDEDPLVRSTLWAAEATMHESVPISPMFGTADARYFADEGIPAVYFGPRGGGMHAPDEWVSLDSVQRVAQVLARTLVQWSEDNR